MPATWSLTPPYFLMFGVLCGMVGFRVGWRSRNRIALPVLQGLFGWGAFLMAWSILSPAWAAATVAAWAVGTTLASVYVFYGRPAETDERVIRAIPYRVAMLEWLATGQGPEGRPLATAVTHLRELIWYAAAAVLTANLASIAMGAVLLNYMNAYVATVLRAATRTGAALLLAWNVWSIVRVAAYVAIGAAAASPLLAMWGMRRGGDAAATLAEAGACGVVLDLVLKLALSRSCGRALGAAVDLEAARANRSSAQPLSLHLD
jgi:hypothetical protein